MCDLIAVCSGGFHSFPSSKFVPCEMVLVRCEGVEKWVSRHCHRHKELAGLLLLVAEQPEISLRRLCESCESQRAEQLVQQNFGQRKFRKRRAIFSRGLV